ncbi:MAG: response regulator [Candidatus Acidiferrales bacterium]
MEKTVASLSRSNLTVCVLDDEPDQVELVTTRLAKAGFTVEGTTDPNEALEKVRVGSCRVVLADIKMPGTDGLALLEKAQRIDPGIYIIFVTGFYSVDSAIEAVKQGAYDYLCKPLDYARLLRTLDELAEVFTQRSQVRQLQEQLLSNLKFHGIVGKSPAMLELFDLARKSRVTTPTSWSAAPLALGRSWWPAPSTR